jgi:hypothetical protein
VCNRLTSHLDRRTISPDPSVDPSSTRITSRGRTRCAATLAIALLIQGAAL